MTMWQHFASTGPVAPSSIERWGPMVPPEIRALWTDVGTGLIGVDGYIRVIDPEWYAPGMDVWLDNADGAVPFLTTGMGDVFVWKDLVIRLILYRTGEVRGIAPEFESLWSLLELEPYLDAYLSRGDYPGGVQRLGVPAVRDAFYYVPFLMLGGAPGPENLQSGALAVTLELFGQMVGKGEL